MGRQLSYPTSDAMLFKPNRQESKQSPDHVWMEKKPAPLGGSVGSVPPPFTIQDDLDPDLAEVDSGHLVLQCGKSRVAKSKQDDTAPDLNANVLPAANLGILVNPLTTTKLKSEPRPLMPKVSADINSPTMPTRMVQKTYCLV